LVNHPKSFPIVYFSTFPNFQPGRALASPAPLSHKSGPPTENRVPSLIKFLLLAGILAGIVYGGMIALVTFVEPQPREMSQTIPPARLNK
jgi:hypothetical protein